MDLVSSSLLFWCESLVVIKTTDLVYVLHMWIYTNMAFGGRSSSHPPQSTGSPLNASVKVILLSSDCINPGEEATWTDEAISKLGD